MLVALRGTSSTRNELIEASQDSDRCSGPITFSGLPSLPITTWSQPIEAPGAMQPFNNAEDIARGVRAISCFLNKALDIVTLALPAALVPSGPLLEDVVSGRQSRQERQID